MPFHYTLDREIEFLEDEASYIENEQRLANLNPHDEPKKNGGDCEVTECLFEVAEQMFECSENDQQAENLEEVCRKCIQLDMDLQKSKQVIAKLQKKCREKNSEIKRLRASEKRAKIVKSSLEEIMRQIKEKKWISEEGEEVMNVICPNFML